MNLKYEWINTLFIILPLSLCVFIIVDIAYNERIWELDTFCLLYTSPSPRDRG